MPIVVDAEQAAAKSRMAAIRLSLLTLRCMDNWRRGVTDYDSAMILIAVVAITAERLTRAGLEDDLQSLETSLPSERLAKCNISSIAAGTGLNRETTRRKVNELIAAGQLVRSSDGRVEFAPGLLQSEEILQLIRKQLDSFVRITNDLVRDGILRQE